MKLSHRLESVALHGVASLARSLSHSQALGLGALLGSTVQSLGVRAKVARANLARAFPDAPAARRAAILTAHYRELGRVACEYPRLPELVRAPFGEVMAATRGVEHLDAAARDGRGAIILTAHYGAFEFGGAWIGQRHPTSFVVQGISNPSVDAWVTALRHRAGIGTLRLGESRGIVRALRENRFVAMLADQDARRAGVFVPFFGSPASTPRGPAALALRARVPLLMGWVTRRDDGRLELEILPKLEVPDPDAPDAVSRLTALHVALLEDRVRAAPEPWFWLHRRWKTPPPPLAEEK
ncbi:MAG: lysophospholipid acyltransferase family protein [Candidatus Eisenbacteria bacterium]|uniref:Lysophospholipid acyltransferase family protein n=1 Tax=Eiseniibacteriota bacterium TaxID=2212470 RepID=A0A849SMM7_UNCEI|nr:lysophospholipid acyltransferase family protein [Candidatus Eisenbacteria bacterium]